MCTRRKRGVKRKQKQKRQTRARKKLTCCQRCRRRIRNWLCKRIKRCVKKTIFGDPNPQLDDFEIAGINLGSVRDNLKINKSQTSLKKNNEITVENKPTIVTLFRKNRDKSIKNIPIKDAIINEYDRYSVSKSIGKKVKSFINDFKERNLFLDVSKDSKLHLDRDEKERLRNLAKKYENKSVLYRSYESLRKRFPLTASKSLVFKKMIDDFNNGKFSLTVLGDKQIRDIKNVNSQDLNKLLAHYESQRKMNGIFDGKSRVLRITNKIDSKRDNFSIKNLEVIRNMNKQELKKKFSLSESKTKMLGSMIDDCKKGKISLSGIRRDVKKDLKIINKENLNVILDYYKNKQSRHNPIIVKQSKFKQLKSDLRAKIGFL